MLWYNGTQHTPSCMAYLSMHGTVQGLCDLHCRYTIATVDVAAASVLPRRLLARDWLSTGAHAAARERGRVSQTVTLQLKSHVVGKGQLARGKGAWQGLPSPSQITRGQR